MTGDCFFVILASVMPSSTSPANWFGPSEEGQLSVDVFREGSELVVRSTVAGVKPEDLDISVHGDLLTIRGTRKMTKNVSEEDWYYRECYWGAFSRSVVLPHEVATDQIKASLTNGVLEIRIPILTQGKKVKVSWKKD